MLIIGGWPVITKEEHQALMDVHSILSHDQVRIIEEAVMRFCSKYGLSFLTTDALNPYGFVYQARVLNRS